MAVHPGNAGVATRGASACRRPGLLPEPRRLRKMEPLRSRVPRRRLRRGRPAGLPERRRVRAPCRRRDDARRGGFLRRRSLGARARRHPRADAPSARPLRGALRGSRRQRHRPQAHLLRRRARPALLVRAGAGASLGEAGRGVAPDAHPVARHLQLRPVRRPAHGGRRLPRRLRRSGNGGCSATAGRRPGGAAGRAVRTARPSLPAQPTRAARPARAAPAEATPGASARSCRAASR